MISLICAATAGSFLFLAAITDVACRVVPNSICAALAADGLIEQGLTHTLPASLIAATCVFVPAVVCWRHGLMGGGDTKLLSVASLLVPASMTPYLVLTISLIGGLLAGLYWMMKQLSGARGMARGRGAFFRVVRIEQHRIRRGFSLPYAVAISMGTILTLGREMI